MRRRFQALATVLALVGTVVGAQSSRWVTERPPPGFTGGFGESSCISCHIGSDVNAFGGSVQLRGVPARYVGGEVYALTVVLQAEETSIAGFQISARHAAGVKEGRNAGRLSPLDERVARSDSASISYLHHSREGAETSDPNGATWSFAWAAPSGGGDVVFHLAANSGNADNSPLGDLVYTHEVTVARR